MVNYYIADRTAGEFVLFWKNHGKGRTVDFSEASVFTEHEAKQYGKNPDVIVFPCELIVYPIDTIPVVSNAVLCGKIESSEGTG